MPSHLCQHNMKESPDGMTLTRHEEQGKGQDRSSDVSLTLVFRVFGLTHKRCVSMVIKV